MRVLLIEDDHTTRKMVQALLRELDPGLTVDSFDNANKALGCWATHTHPLVLVDWVLPGLSGPDFIRQVRPQMEHTYAAIMTSKERDKDIEEAFSAGANDFLAKPVIKFRLRVLVNAGRAMERTRQTLDEVARLRTHLQKQREEMGMIGAGLDIVRQKIEQVAPYTISVLVTGETGTGKELVARAIHDTSRRNGSFLAVNCALISQDLAESTLFGHRRGAFTGARSDQRGLVDVAHLGTLFLDEIGEMPLVLQAKLLRFLETGEFRRVGEPMVRKVDVRVVAATNRNLPQMILDNTFRGDLFYRLNGFPIVIPALRDRKQDIPSLVRYFLDEYCLPESRQPPAISPAAMDVLLGYTWPGNIRELRQVVERCIISGMGSSQIDARHMPSDFFRVKDVPAWALDEGLNIQASRKRRLDIGLIRDMLARVDGNQTEAARRLGVDRTTIYRHLRKSRF